jgi:hypothetical protein
MVSASSDRKSKNVSTHVKGSDGPGYVLNRPPCRVLERDLWDDSLMVRDSDQDGIVCLLLPIGNCILSRREKVRTRVAFIGVRRRHPDINDGTEIQCLDGFVKMT